MKKIENIVPIGNSHLTPPSGEGESALVWTLVGKREIKIKQNHKKIEIKRLIIYIKHKYYLCEGPEDIETL